MFVYRRVRCNSPTLVDWIPAKSPHPAAVGAGTELGTAGPQASGRGAGETSGAGLGRFPGMGECQFQPRSSHELSSEHIANLGFQAG